METIFAPWRMDYIKGEKPEGCVFASVPSGVMITLFSKVKPLT